MLFKNSKASIEQCDTHINGPQSPASPALRLPTAFRREHATHQDLDANTEADGFFLLSATRTEGI